jgi:hypothetical protein
MANNIEDKLSQLYGQIAALEHLVVALYLAKPNKSEVQTIFTRQTERNAALDLYSDQPEEFLKGFSIRQTILAELLSAGAAGK